MKKQSLKTNFIFQIIYNIVIIVIPFIISPILTRTLGETCLGSFTFITSIGYYFVIFANLGIKRHGQRIISANSDNHEKLRTSFWSLFFVHSVFSLLSIFFYILFILFFVSEDATIYWINVLYVSSALFDLTWLFYGLENFKSVAVKNLIVRLVTFSLILLLIKQPGDLWLYCLFESGSLMLGNILLIPSVIKEIPFKKFNLQDCISHLKPLLLLSVSVIAASLYTVFDKTLLGVMLSKESVAFYEYSNKIINIVTTFLGVIGTILFPRACLYARNNDIKSQRKITKYAYILCSFISFGAIFGLLAIGKQFAVIYYGENFAPCGDYILVMTPLIIIIGLGDIVRSIYLIPMKKDLVFVGCICTNALINIALSVLLIPKIGVYGAIIGTMSAELFGVLFQMVYCRKMIVFKDIFFPLITFLINGIMMFIVLSILKNVIGTSISGIFLLIIVGFVIYSCLSFLSICFFYKDIWNEIRIRLFKRERG